VILTVIVYSFTYDIRVGFIMRLLGVVGGFTKVIKVGNKCDKDSSTKDIDKTFNASKSFIGGK
jgi:hypothetical protein